MHAERRNMAMIAAVTLFIAQGGGAATAEPATRPALTWPFVRETVSPVEQLTVDSPTGCHCPVLVRRPPGPGPFPLVVVVHGGVNPQSVERLRADVTTRHNVVRLLAAGYAIAAPTFSSRKEDPQTTAALRDCVAVIERVRHLPGMDSQSVFVFGGSGGGSLALELAGETKLAAIAAGEPANVLFTGVWTQDNIPELQTIMDDPLKYCDNEKIRSFTRAKIDKIACPVLIVHSDVHPINKINDLFVIPMMKEAGKTPEICYVPGVRHGFYFASAENPQATLKAFEAIDSFFRRHSPTPPTPIDPSKLEPRPTSEGAVGADETPQPGRAASPPLSRRAASKGAESTRPTPQDTADIDWDRVRALRQRALAGETLKPEEQAYYERGKAARRSGEQPGKAARRNGEQPASQGAEATPLPPKTSTGFIPLCDMAADQEYKGEEGGLYGGGGNTPPEAHLQAALTEAAKIQPLDADGKPSPGGKIVMLTHGMSATTLESRRFIELANADPRKNPAALIVDGAQGGVDSRDWVEDTPSRSGASPWDRLEQRIQSAGTTPQQVQVVWMKHAIAMKSEGRVRQLGEFPQYPRQLKEDMAQILGLLKQRFPNLKIAYVSSRSYAGYANTPLNPEPYAYESAFAVRWLIQDQMKGEDSLDYAAGKAPLLLWGPYLWANGEKGRKVDGLVYKREDYVADDGTHPSDSGQQKIAEQLLEFFTTDPTATGWFVEH